MKKITFFKTMGIAVLALCSANTTYAQFSFQNSNSLFGTQTRSGNCLTVVDVNNDGLDDILTMDQSNDLVLELQHENGTYTYTMLGTVSGGNVWGMAAADVDHNGWKDVATGAGSTTLFKLSESGGVVSATQTLLTNSYFVQNITFGDFNNDGWVDVSVCDDNDYDKIYQNDGTGNLIETSTLINTNINPGLVYGSDPYDSGNYGSVWLDFDNDGDLDLYIAHCRQSTSSYTDERRRDRLFVNDGSNNYTENALAYGIETTGDFKQTWTTSFGDMDNDGDFDVVLTNHGEASQIFQNDGTGHFTDITSGSGYSVGFDAIESEVEDFDNDGFLDILVTGPGWVMYHNNGNGTYTQTPGVMAGTNILSFGMGDLNHDGKIDIFASYGSVYNSPSTTTDDVLYLNTSNNTNHYITFNLTGTVSNVDAVGARVTIYGPWGKQIREVRAGDSYGTGMSMQLHFGLGSATTVDSARIDWPSHLYTNHFTNLAADQFLTVVEGGCSIVGNIIPGPFAFCTGSTITLNAASGFSSYVWNDASSSSTTSITVSTTGSYNVTVTDAAGCTNISPTVTTTLNPDETPILTTSGVSAPCAGNLTIMATPANSYSWTGPSGFSATTQAITPPTSGTYSLTTVGTCQSYTATPITVNVFAVPTAPTGTGASGAGPISLNLSATGTGGILNWYDMASGGTLLGSGATFSTPVINSSTTYYVDESSSNPGITGHTSQMFHTGSSNYSGTTTNGIEVFDVLSGCTLQSVKVYTDSTHYGIREFQLLNSSGTVINSLSVNLLTDTSVVALNWAIPIGVGYQLTTNGTINTTNFGVVAPYLFRSNGGFAYPYTLSGIISVTGSNPTGRVYYFYDWVVQADPVLCASARTGVLASITAGINELENIGISVYPNPVNNEVTVAFENATSSATVEITDVTGRLIKSWTIDKPAQGQKTKLNVSEISEGTYFLTIKSASKMGVEKLVITK